MDILIMVLDRIGCNIHHNCTRIDYTSDGHYIIYEQDGSTTKLNKNNYMLIILRD